MLARRCRMRPVSYSSVCVYFSSIHFTQHDFFQLFILEFGGLWLRVTCVARVWPFVLVVGVRVSNMLVSGYG